MVGFPPQPTRQVTNVIMAAIVRIAVRKNILILRGQLRKRKKNEDMKLLFREIIYVGKEKTVKKCCHVTCIIRNDLINKVPEYEEWAFFNKLQEEGGKGLQKKGRSSQTKYEIKNV